MVIKREVFYYLFEVFIFNIQGLDGGEIKELGL